jgi:hypothetical protein
MPPGRERISQNVSDISSVDQLLRYATASQVQRLLTEGSSLTQGKIAKGAGFGSSYPNAGAALSTALRKGLTTQNLQRLDEIIGALAPDLDSTGGLSSLALRLEGGRDDEVRGSNLTARVPPSWTKKILQEPNPGEIGVLIQASALLSAFLAADKMSTGMSIIRIRDRYEEQMDKLVSRLILISVGPPTSRNYDAQVVLGSLASYAFDFMKGRLEHELRSAPLGFRVWRAITKLVKISGHGEQADALKVWVRHLVGEAGELRKTSLYAGRSLDLETAITVPGSWSPPDDDWVGEALCARAWDRDATIRERGTAAEGLWQRAIAEDRPGLEKAKEDLRKLIDEFRDPDSRPDAAAGLRWVALTLERVMGEEVAVCNDWPDPGESWFGHVQEAADRLDKSEIPLHLREGTKNLFRHMILQNAGVYRRQAIETVVTSGWSDPVARALGFLLKKEQDQAWLRVRAEFALGMLQYPDPRVEEFLTNACLRAYKNLRLGEVPDHKPPRSCVTEMHSSLFAVGDCFGVAGAEERAKAAREKLRDVLIGLASTQNDGAKMVRRTVRGAAYLLVVTAQPRVGNKKDLSQELLEKLRDHPDEVTARLARWALSFRFARDGTIRPLLAAADYETSY